jgi:N-acetyl-anhydromuramyl-L-alanine amidase AmpD
VVHHSATDEGSARAFDRYHRKVKGWTGLAYHFVIGNGAGTPDGAVEVGYRWKQQTPGAHAGVREYNRYGIGICLVGDFENNIPTGKQMASLRVLLGSLAGRFGVRPENVVRHRDVGETKCPGRNFPWPVAGIDETENRKPDARLRKKARKRLGIH